LFIRNDHHVIMRPILYYSVNDERKCSPGARFPKNLMTNLRS